MKKIVRSHEYLRRTRRKLTELEEKLKAEYDRGYADGADARSRSEANAPDNHGSR
jgi:hypothetical protein